MHGSWQKYPRTPHVTLAPKQMETEQLYWMQNRCQEMHSTGTQCSGTYPDHRSTLCLHGLCSGKEE